ncbi:hypothetical protein MTO96_016228 [Rhipicephalus appendiculatus]
MVSVTGSLATLLHIVLAAFHQGAPAAFKTDTFYSRVDDRRVVSLQEVASGSWKVLAATVALPAIFAFVYVVVGDERRSIFRAVSDAAFFLLATFLATSTVQPKAVGRAGVARRALLGLWLATLLPLAVYFRSELTAVITLKRPAYRIDTLQKLEDALDRRQVAPCITRTTRMLDYFHVQPRSGHLSRQSLLMKLRFAFEQRGAEALVTNDFIFLSPVRVQEGPRVLRLFVEFAEHDA